MMPKRRVIPVFVPHLGCPNDCVFCNQRRISGAMSSASPAAVRLIVDSMVLPENDGVKKQLAFYGGSFTALPVPEQEALLEAAQDFTRRYPAAGLRLSTRPDCVDRETLLRLKEHGVETIELGAQSMDDGVLMASGRGHTSADTADAARLVKEMGFELILQMMTGLPEDTPEKSIDTARRLIALNPDGVRIYPTVIVRDTALYEMWRRGDYREHSVDDAVSLCAQIAPLFEEAGIPVIRLGLNPTEELTAGAVAAGAYHPAFGELVYSRIYLNRARAILPEQGNFTKVTLGVSKKHVSVMIGQRRSNIDALRREFGGADIRVAGTDVEPGEIVILRIEKTH